MMRSVVRTRLHFMVLAALLAMAAPVLAQDEAPTAVFIVNGLRNDVGVVAGGIYADPHVWTREGGQVAVCHGAIHAGTARCVIRAPEPGTYAFAFLHDEDGDGRMHTDALGLPQEGYGFGNDAHGTLGAPSFESASYRFESGQRLVSTLNVRYGLGL
jgi:uncharacterized protein (DUF2141 family)